MNIVVTGASGNVGTALLRRLHEAGGATVTGVVRRPPDPAAEPYAHARWVSLDLGEPGAQARLAEVLAGADAVVHLAWAINPPRGEPPMSRTNLDGSRAVLRAVAEAGVPHLVCASSVAAYTPPPRWRTVTEEWPCDGVPGSAYSRGKARLETMLDEFEAEYPVVTVARIRPCAIAQRDAGGEFARWVLSPLLPAGLLGRDWLPLPLWPGLRAQLVHSADVAEAIRLILARHAAGPFNLAGDDVLDANRMAAVLGGFALPVPRAALFPLDWVAWRLGLQPTHPGWLRLADRAALANTHRARTELGWEPAYSSREVLTEMLAGLREGTGTDSPPLAPQHLTGLTDRLRRIGWGAPSHHTQS